MTTQKNFYNHKKIITTRQ